MATILFTWELGLAMGHVGTLRPLAEALGRKGHRVYAALKDVMKARHLAPQAEFPCLQAPVRLNPVRGVVHLPSTFAHVLYNAGFGSAAELRPLADAWRAIFDLVKPDLLVLEHSPTALLASFSRRVRRVCIGTGFTCPPDLTPLPDWRPNQRNDPDRLLRDEEQVRSTIIELLVEWGQMPLAKVTDLYTRADETFLTTFEELDHFGPRRRVEYWGTGFSSLGTMPQWPRGSDPKVFAYLKPFAALDGLLSWLAEQRLPTLIYCPEIDPKLQARLESETLQFASQPVDLAAAGKWCDVALLNATHGTTAAMLLAGRPTLQIPLFLEQQLTADNVVRMGAGLIAPANRPDESIRQLTKLLSDGSFAQAAQRFQQRYAHFDRRGQLDRLIARVEQLL